MSTDLLKSPYSYYGGKSTVGEVIWSRLGWDVGNFIDPFLGSNAVLLTRPNWTPRRNWIEVINDIDGFICNFWRAVRHDPEKVAAYADWITNENDLHARHAWLVGKRTSITTRLEGDPDWYNAKIAGWWVWGMALWISGGFCSGKGPWIQIEDENGHLVLRKREDELDAGVCRKRPHLTGTGEGVKKKSVMGGVTRGRIELRHQGNGVTSQSGRADLIVWMQALCERMNRVKVCCGDWSRICGTTPTVNQGCETAVLLDPPYGESAHRASDLYAQDDLKIAADVLAWCVANGDNMMLRIALCGYVSEHSALEQHGWSVYNWKTQGGHANQSKTDSRGKQNKERIWFSPHCLKAVQSLPIFRGKK